MSEWGAPSDEVRIIVLNSGAQHWYLFVVWPSQGRVVVLDSAQNDREDVISNFNALAQWMKVCHNKDLHVEQITSVQQSNSYDCGLFVVKNATEIIRNPTPKGLQERLQTIEVNMDTRLEVLNSIELAVACEPEYTREEIRAHSFHGQESQAPTEPTERALEQRQSEDLLEKLMNAEAKQDKGKGRRRDVYDPPDST